MSQIDARAVARRHVTAATWREYFLWLAVGIACAACGGASTRSSGVARSDARASAHAARAAEPADRTSSQTPERESGATPRQPEISGKPAVSVLPVPGFESAILVVPERSQTRPLLVATHGAGGAPEWECERWSRVAKGRWILLCPRGVPLRRGEEGSYFYPDHHALEREVTAGVKAARAALGTRVTAGGGVYVGYSQGATMGALMLVDHGAEFAHLLLIEGGSADWTSTRAARFHATGGKSVFIVCGTTPCAERATRAKPVLERAGLRAEVRAVPDGGHTELGPVGNEAEKLLESLATL